MSFLVSYFLFVVFFSEKDDKMEINSMHSKMFYFQKPLLLKGLEVYLRSGIVADTAKIERPLDSTRDIDERWYILDLDVCFEDE